MFTLEKVTSSVNTWNISIMMPPQAIKPSWKSNFEGNRIDFENSKNPLKDFVPYLIPWTE